MSNVSLHKTVGQSNLTNSQKSNRSGITLDSVDLKSCKFSTLKEHLEIAKKIGDKDMEGYIRKVMTKKYIEHKKQKKNQKVSGYCDNNNNNGAITKNNLPTLLPPIPLPSMPSVIPYTKKKDKYSNILVSQINMRNRLDSDYSIAESIRNNSKAGFIKPYA